MGCPWIVSCLLSLVCGLFSTGCIYRSLTVKTDPPGALVYVNDELKGTSPVTYDFMWYGWHRVTLRKEGYERLEDRRLLRAPIHFWIPFDLVMELLPVPIRDQRTWQYALTPAAAPPAPVPPELFGDAAKPAPRAQTPLTPPTLVAPPSPIGPALAIPPPQPLADAAEAAPDSEATP